jgi:hypothetical protein
MDIDGLKEHIDEKFSNHEQMDKLRHNHFEETLKRNSSDIEKNETAVKRVHGRVDRIETQIKTVQGVGTAIATALGAAAAWIGLTGKS